MIVKDNPLLYLILKTWQYSKGNQRNVVVYFILSSLANALSLSEPLVIALILNTIQTQGLDRTNLTTIILYLAIIAGINIVFWAFHGPSRVLETKNAFLVRANFKRYLLGGTMDLPVEWHTDHHSGDTIDKIEKGTGALYNFSTDTFVVIESLVRLVGSFVALVYFNFSSIYIVIVMMIITIWLIIAFDKILVAQYKELNKAENTISAKVYDAISNITTVIILRVEKLVTKAIVKKIMQPFKLFGQNSKINEKKWFLVTVCSSVMTFLIMGTYLYNVVHSGAVIAIGSIYALYGYIQKITDLFFRFAYMYGDIVRNKTAVMNAEEISKEFKDRTKTKETTLGNRWSELSVQSLKFSYHTKDGADLHLDNISLIIKRGEKTALIGASGSGKTTFLKLMRGLYEPRQLNLFVDNKRLQNGFNSISSEIALIPQDPEIFATTIKENITIGVDHSLARIKVFTDLARFTDVVERLPKKFDSSIVEKGVNLSGGEKQRLALARGLMACEDKAIILLDEPTSSIDFRNEMQIYQNIFKRFKDRAIVSSVHRLHLLPLFDKIYFFSNGQIVASGNFQELLATFEPFKEMWEKHTAHSQA